MILKLAFLLLLLDYNFAEEQASWSWGKDAAEPKQEEAIIPDLQQTASSNIEEIEFNSTNLEEVVTDILELGREGRNLNGYDEVYSDPNIQEVLQKGDDTQARNLIKDRLCHLGLMQVFTTFKNYSFLYKIFFFYLV